jgi:hypothetical protein
MGELTDTLIGYTNKEKEYDILYYFVGSTYTGKSSAADSAAKSKNGFALSVQNRFLFEDNLILCLPGIRLTCYNQTAVFL